MPNNTSMWIRWSPRRDATRARSTRTTPVLGVPVAPQDDGAALQRIALATAVAMSLATASRARNRPLDQAFVLDFSGAAAGATLLAAQATTGQRELEHALAQLLAGYRAIERQLGLSADDPAAALAAFIAGNLAAFGRGALPDAGFLALAAQLRAHPEVITAFHADRPTVAEELAILGMLMLATTFDRDTHDAAQLHARRHLRRYFGCEAADLELTAHGLRWARGLPTGPLAILVRTPRTHAAAAVTRAAPASDAIQTVAFRPVTRYGGYRGAVTYAWEPIILFASGDAALAMTALADPAADKQAHPARWTTWRRTARSYELWDGEAWVATAWTSDPAPRHFKLDGRYAHDPTTSTAPATACRDIHFDRAGRFILDRGPAAPTSTTSPVTGDGNYTIVGYRLALHHHDGRIETHSVVITGDKQLIWLDGIEYQRKP